MNQQQSVTLSVDLALQNAKSQAAALRKILNESVKPDSTAYRELEKLLNKIELQADGFKQSMGEALKTSSGTQKFNNDMQKLFNLLGTAAEHFRDLKGKDLIFSDEDTQRINELNTRIKDTTENIRELRKGKINGVFSDSTITEFKQIQEFAQKLGLDLNNLTFENLSKALSKELKTVNNTIDDSVQKVLELNEILNNVNLTDINKLSENLKKNINKDSITGLLTQKGVDEARAGLATLYQQNAKYLGKQAFEDVGTGENIAKAFEKENKILDDVLGQRIALLISKKERIKDALEELKKATYTGGNPLIEAKNKEIISNQTSLLQELGFDKIFDQKTDLDNYVTAIKEFLINAYTQAADDQQIYENARTNMENGLRNLFDKLDTEKVVGNKKLFAEGLSHLLEGEGVNLKDSGLTEIFKQLDGMNADTAIQKIAEAMQQYIIQVRQAKVETDNLILTKQDEAAKITESQNVVNNAAQQQRAEINNQITNVEQLRQEIEKIVAARIKEAKASLDSSHVLEENTENRKKNKEVLDQYTASVIKSEQRTQNLNSIRTAITNWMGFNQVLNLTRRAVSEAINHIKQLDTTMNGIAIVTNMTTADLWKQVDAYSEMAQKFGVTIQGAYEVSKIYYQAGYETNEVLTLTNETLKLAKISGLDYATTTDYMMTAMRGFKLEMEDASHVVDVYSNLAANTAVSQQELAEAMTRTASSMESVGATFEETSAMIATVVAVTRESANNIGSMMKSIASRYGELTKNPQALIDADGEAMSFNKVDEALKSVGISLQTTDHQFRDFTDVIMELAEVWDDLDSAQQRYIATQFAGNRQQSRFLALVSNVDLLKQNIQNAENSEDVGTLQTLKALDSLESKLNQVQVAYQQFYTTIGIENVWKALLDSTRTVIDTLNGLPKLFGKLPVNAAAVVYSVIQLIKTVALEGFASLATQIKARLEDTGKQLTSISAQAGKDGGTEYKLNWENAAKDTGKNTGKQLKETLSSKEGLTKVVSVLGSTSVLLGAILDKSTRVGQVTSGWATGIGGALQAGAGFARVLSGDLSAIPSILSGILNLFNGFSIAYESTGEKLERLKKEAEELNNEAKNARANYNTLQRSLKKVEELEQKRYDSIEATEEYNDAVNDLAESFPELISSFDATGNAILDVTNKEKLLEIARRKSAKAALDAAEADLKAKETQYNLTQEQLELFDPAHYNTELTLSGKTQLQKFQEDIIDYIDNANFDNYQKDWLHTFSISLRNATSLEDFFSGIESILNNEQLNEWASDEDNYFIKDYQEKLKDILNNQITDFTDDQIETINKINQSIENYYKSEKTSEDANNLITEVYDLIGSDEILSSYFSDLLQYFKIYNKNIEEGLEAKIELNSTAKLLASQWQNAQLLNNKQYDYLKEDSEFATILNKEFSEQVNTYEDYINLQSDWADEMQSVNNYWITLTDDSKELFNSMIQANSKYSSIDIIGMKEFADMDEELQNKLINYYAESIKNIQDRLNSQFLQANINKTTVFTTHYNEVIKDVDTEIEANYLSTILSNYVELQNKGFATYAESYGEAALTLYSQIQTLAPTLRANILDIIKQYVLNSREGINSIKDFIFNNTEYSALSVEVLDEIYNTIIPNVQLGIQTAIDSLLESWSNTSKDLSKVLSGGLDLKEADALITKAESLGLELDINKDFIYAGDKLILTSEAFGLYIQALNESSNKLYLEYQSNVISAEQILAKAEQSNLINAPLKISDDEKKILASIGFDINSYISDGNILIGNWSTALKESIDITNEGLSTLTSYLNIANQQLLQSAEWKKGNYQSVGGRNAIITNASHEAQLLLDRETDKNLLDAVKYFNSAYSALLRDAISKGYDNINPADYEGLLDEEIEWTDSYPELVRKYVNFAGLTIEEANDLMLQAIEKQQEKTVGASEVLKDVTFIKEGVAFASKETIGKLATLFELEVTDLFNPDNYNSIFGGYQIELSKIPGLDKITDAKQMMEDSIASYFQSVTNLISTGLAGKLTAANKDELLEALKQYDIDLDLQFTKTAEGLQLATDSAIELYAALSQIDSIQSNLLFNDLKTALEKTGEDCENISVTMATIKKLEKELKDPANANNKILQERYKLYKQIAAAQSQEANQFKFMDQSLPDNLQGVVNAWSSAQQALNIIAEAKVSGYMDLADYRNIVQQIAYGVEEIDGKILYLGQEYKDRAELMTTLMQAGTSSFVTTANGVKVGLAKVGENIGLGTDEMNAGVHQFIENFAQGQIEMLEAEINFLKGIQALEELDFADTLNKIFEDGGKIFADNDFSTEYHDFINKLNQNESLVEVLKSYTISDGVTLYDILTDFHKGYELFNGDLNAWETALKKFAELSDGYDFEPTSEAVENIIKEIQDSIPDTVKKDVDVKVTPHYKKIDPRNGAKAALDLNGDEIGVNKTSNSGFQDTSSSSSDNIEEVQVKVSYVETEEGLQQLINNLDGIIRNIGVTSDSSVEIPVNFDNVKLTEIEDGIYTLNTISGEPVTVEVHTSGFDTSGLTETKAGSKVYTITTSKGQEIQVAINANLLDSGLSPSDLGPHIYTIDTTDANAIKIQINPLGLEDGSIGLIGNPKEGYTLHTVDGQVISISASVGEVTGLTFDSATNNYILQLASGQTIEVTGSLIDYNENLSANWDEKTAFSKLQALTGYVWWFSQKLSDGWDPKTQFYSLNDLIGYLTGYQEEGSKSQLLNGLTSIFGMTGTVSKVIPSSVFSTLAVLAAIAHLNGGISEFYPNWSEANNPNNLISQLTAAVIDVFNLHDIAESKVKDLSASIGEVDNTKLQNLTGTASIFGSLSRSSQNKLNKLKAKAKEIEIPKENLPTPEINVLPILKTEQLQQDIDDFKKKNADFFDPYLDPTVRAAIIEDANNNNYPDTDFHPESMFSPEWNAFLKAVHDLLVPSDEIPEAPTYSFGELPGFTEEELRLWQETQAQQQQANQANQDNTTAVKGQSKAIAAHTGKISIFGSAMQKASEKASTSSSQFGSFVTNLITLNVATKQLSNTMVNAINRIKEAVKGLPSGNSSAKGTKTSTTSTSKPISNKKPFIGGGSGRLGENITADPNAAKGNIALAGGHKTLMGELGEELYVTNGHYYIAGRFGPEFVDLPDDAIVFNHLQTQRLLKNGSTPTHGKPVTTEQKAVAFASGSLGPAKASVSETIGVLTEILNAWKDLLKTSPKMLGAIAGKGGGGGGGGKTSELKQYVDDIQRWYNLLRQIDKLEKDINYQETLRAKIQSELNGSGTTLYASYKKSLSYLEQEVDYQRILLQLQQKRYDELQQQLDNSIYGQIFTFENGTIQYRTPENVDSKAGLAILAALQERDMYGRPINNAENAETQYNYIKALVEGAGFSMEPLFYKEDGTKIELDKAEDINQAYYDIVENFFKEVESYQSESEELLDALYETSNTILEKETEQNEIIREIREKEIDLENQILDAIVAQEQKRIDDAKKELDAIKESTDKFIQGLSDQLSKERQMYERQQSADDLLKLRRQLAILQRSGGSASQIQSLQREIDSKSRDQYFDSQQEQIDAVKEASDLEIERLNTQIELMEESLEYQKAHGLLWEQVRDIMALTAEEITDFILSNNPDYEAASTLSRENMANETRQLAEFWKASEADRRNSNVQLQTDKEDWTVTNTTNTAQHPEFKPSAGGNAGVAGDNNDVAQATEHKGLVSDIHVDVNREKNSDMPYDNVRRLQRGLQALGYYNDEIDGIFGYKTEKALMKFQEDNGLSVDGKLGKATRAAFAAKGYSAGGIVDYTGLAMVHGSKTKPESFLDSEDTKLLKEDLLARQNILPDLIGTYRAMQAAENSLTTNNSTTNEGSVNIEQVDVNISVDSIANDYDASRLAEQVTNKLLSIARKSGNIGINRR